MKKLSVKTTARTEMIEITGRVQQAVSELGITDGIVLLYVSHTTAAITINEGADPAVRSDIISVLNEMVPWNYAYRHLEGNSAAHIKASLIGPGEHVIVEEGRLCLGTWQKIFFCEFDGPRDRKLWIKALKEFCG